MFKEVVLCRLKDRTRKDLETNCWLWLGCLVDGYGQLKVDNKIYTVHRLSAYIFFNYDLKNKELQINHKEICKNRHCWNPEHIYIGTQSENYWDAFKFGKHNNRIKHKRK